MAKFRKKPVEVEAMQLGDSPASLTAIIEWAASQGVEMVAEHDGQESHCLHFLTQNGVNTAYVGDWVVKDCGLFHRCSNAVFAETDEAA